MIAAPKNLPRLIRVDAKGQVETFASMRAGNITGLVLPAGASDVGRWVDAELMPVIDAGSNKCAEGTSSSSPRPQQSHPFAPEQSLRIA